MKTNGHPRASRLPVKKARIPLRDKILAAADDLFQKQGTRSVGVEAIAEAAGTNKMTLYRHFESKDELVAEWVRALVARKEKSWSELEAKYEGNPQALLREWSRKTAAFLRSIEESGCHVANSIADLIAAGHPAGQLILDYKAREHKHVRAACKAAGITDPAMTANLFSMMAEGAQSCGQYVGMRKIGEDLVKVVDQMIAAGRSAQPKR